MEWPAAAWICSITRVEKKTPPIKLAKRTLEIPLPGVPTVGFVLRQVHLRYAQVVDFSVREIVELRT
jgi:hypothetical protein